MLASFRTILPAFTVAVAIAVPASAAAATPPAHHEGLSNVDLRPAEASPVPAAMRGERAGLRQDLGELAQVRPASSGGVSYVGSPTALLTEPSTDDPADIALDYVREHQEVFALSRRDVANLELVSRSTSPDGITHLRFNQVLRGIQSFDSGIEAHVTRDGRLINVSGAPVPNAALPASPADPALDALGGLGAAHDATGGSGLPPSTADTDGGGNGDGDDDHDTTFSTGERALLRWTPGPDGRAQLAWHVIAEGGDGHLYDALVDARDGDLLRRQDLTHQLGAAKYFPADPARSPATQITMPPAWYDDHAGGTRLWGQYARTYVDPTDEDPAPGAEAGPTLVQVPASGGAPTAPDWLYAQSTTFPGATPCPLSGCTWDSAVAGSETTNQFQAATNAHVLASRFHDHLQQAPIGFDEASGNFQRDNVSSSDGGDDYVQLEVNDGEGLDNANMATPPDGTAPRMQMYLFTSFAVNGSDVADVVYHEYAHGLSNRLVVNVSGASTLLSNQAQMMGEAWSDFYALDLLAQEGWRTDTAAPGELTTGDYVAGPGGIRSKPIDCPVAPAGAPGCDGNFAGAPAVLGGFTYGDISGTLNTSPHHGSEVWAQTLWDIRTAVGSETALALVTGGMRISADNPSMLDMRDAVLQMAIATRSGAGAADDHYAELWRIFAARGMGAGASTPSPNSTAPLQSYEVPYGVQGGGTELTDPYPGGDNDGRIEPGERFEVAQQVTGIGLGDLTGVTGTLGSTDPAVVVEDGTASWPLLGHGRSARNSDVLAARLSATSCTASSPLTITLRSPEGGTSVTTRVDPRNGAAGEVPLNDATSTVAAGVTRSTFTVAQAGVVTDLDVRIDELRHSYLGDLDVQLSHDGVTVSLFSRLGTPDAHGGSNADYGGDDIVDAVFDSDATRTLPISGPGPITGRFAPQVANALDAFDGHSAQGDWVLQITDHFPSDSGVLRHWGLDSPQVAACPRVEIPTATTGGASGIGTTAATIDGAVTPNGRGTGLRFAYGTTDAYGSHTSAIDVGDGDAAQSRTAPLEGLAPNTTYHYRVEAVREGGQVAVAGGDRTFRTSGGATTGGGPVALGPVFDRTPPTVAGAIAVRLLRATVRANRRPALSFHLTEDAAVRVAVAKVAAGRKVGGRCVAPTRANRRAPRCTRLLPVGTWTKDLRAGGRSFALPARGLPKGTYAATVTATDAAGNASVPRRVVLVVT